MKIGYIKPNFLNEKRVGWLPKHLSYCTTEDERQFEQVYAKHFWSKPMSYWYSNYCVANNMSLVS